MRKVILSTQVTLDNFIDHTAMIEDEELNDYATDMHLGTMHIELERTGVIESPYVTHLWFHVVKEN